MEPEKCRRLEEEFKLPEGALSEIRSAQFNLPSSGPRCYKTDGIAWEEHDAGRPFWWLEDGISEHEKEVLAERGYADRWIPCNVTEDPWALIHAHQRLMSAAGEVVR